MHNFKMSSGFLLLFLIQSLHAQSPCQSFRGNLQHTGVCTSSTFSDSGKFKWKFKTDGMVRSTPAVYDGMVFFGSRDKHFYAVDRTKGTMVWKFQTGEEVSSSPAVY
ncbi:MAG: PQQ-binding-like beta-propeller repeat protein [Acidobacteriota bacterium]